MGGWQKRILIEDVPKTEPTFAMRTLPRITEIIKVEPFMVTCKWNTGEVRVIDLGSEFEKWNKEGQTFSNSLSDYEKFKYVTINQSKTLCWPTITCKLEDIHGKIKDEILDLDPDVLYQISLPIEDFKLVRAA